MSGKADRISDALEALYWEKLWEYAAFAEFTDWEGYANSPGPAIQAMAIGDLPTPMSTIEQAHWISPSVSLDITLSPSSDPPDGSWVGAEGGWSTALTSSGLVQPYDANTSANPPIKITATIRHGLPTPPTSPAAFKDDVDW